ncbi:hypothetical protein GE278_18575 [Enterobacteriaceae bacterium Kacie_13]|nr:hypothetical protein GE278_18575 [Enterobacteriaceae bacterium Kacie_13]
MQASDYLRLKFQSDRQLGIYIQRGMNDYVTETKNVLSNISSGMERASWYTSCLIPRYGDVCQELVTEEKRMRLSIISIFRYHDVIQHMLFLYFEMVVKNTEKENASGKIQGLTKAITGHLANAQTGKTARFGIAYALSKSLSGSGIVSNVVAERVASKSPYVIFALQAFGIDQKSALAARKLKTLDPRYYGILYAAELEMLYYFVEPVLEEVIIKVKAKMLRDLDEIYELLGDKYNV